MRKEGSTDTWRVFCAVQLPERVCDLIAEHISELRRVVPEATASWSRPENIHLTLRFLGEIPPSRVESFTLAAARAAEAFTPFILGVGETGVFPPHGSPRVLWIGVEDSSGEMAKLYARLEDESAMVGFEKEARSFHPHLTLARLRRPDRRPAQTRTGATQLARRLATAHREMGFQRVEITVSELLVIRSELTSEGSKYSVISSHPLGMSDEL